MIRSGEACDDSNKTSGDGCSASCVIEDGYICEGEPSECEISCGNGKIASDEACDDDNKVSGDGCSSSCSIEAGYECSGEPSTCVRKPACRDGIDNDGDGKIDHPSDPGCASPGDTNETDLPPQCAQKNESCATSSCCGSLVCDAAAKTCVDPYCGDGTTNGSEQCDDGKADTETCDYDAGDTAGNGCTDRTCGDGYTNEVAGETCDDGNDVDGDGCDQNCQEETCSDCARANGESGADEVMCGQLPGCFYQPFRWWLFWVPASCEKTDLCNGTPVNTCKAGCWKEESPGVCGPNPNSDLVAAVPTTWWGRLTGWVTGSSLTAEVVHYPESGCCCETDDLPDLEFDGTLDEDIGPGVTTFIAIAGDNITSVIAHDVLLMATLPPELSFGPDDEWDEECRITGDRTVECSVGDIEGGGWGYSSFSVRLASAVPPCGTRIPISATMSTSDQERDVSNNSGTVYAVVTCGARVCCTYSADNQESEPACSVRSTREACETPNSGAEAGRWVSDAVSCSEYVCELPDLEVSIDGHTPVAQAVAAGVRNGFGFAVHNIGRGSADNVVIQATFSAPLRAEQLTGTVTGGTCTVNAARTVITCIPNENKLKIEDVLSVDGGAFSLPAAASPMPQCNAPLDFTVTVTTSDVQFDTSNDTQTQAYVVNCGVCCPDPAVTLSCTQANHMPQSQCPSPRTWLAPNNTCSDCPGVEKPKQACCIYEREPSFSREWNPVECRVAEKKTEGAVFCHDVSGEPNVVSEWRTDISEEACRTESAYDVCGKGEVDLKLTKTLKSSDRPPVPGDVIFYDLAVENRPIESVGDVTVPSDPAVDVTINDFSNPQLEFVPEQSDASCRKLLISGSVSCNVGTIAFRESKTITIAFRLKERGTSGCTVTNSALVYADNKEVLMTNNYANAPLNAYCASGTRHCCAPSATSCTQVLLGEDGKCPAYKQGTLDTGYETSSACDAACAEPTVEKFCCSASHSCSRVALVEGKCPAPMKPGTAEGGYDTQALCDGACLPRHPCCMKIEIPGRINPEYVCGTEVSEQACSARIGTNVSTSFNTGKVVEVAYKPYVEQCQQTSCREAFIPKPCCSSGNVCELKLEHECKAAGNDVGTGYSCEDYDEACPKPTYCCSAQGNTCVQKKVGGPACKQGSGPFSDRSCNDSCSPEPTYCCSASGNACVERGDGSACAKDGKEYTDDDCDDACVPPSTPDITIAKTLQGGSGVRKPGDKVVYVITVKNKGAERATGVTVTDFVPTGLTILSMPSNCTDARNITCSGIDIDAGKEHSITLEFTVDPTSSYCTSQFSVPQNRAFVQAQLKYDKVSTNNIASAPGFNVPCPTWEVAKTGPTAKLKPGEVASFTLTFKRLNGDYAGPSPTLGEKSYFVDAVEGMRIHSFDGVSACVKSPNETQLTCDLPPTSKDGVVTVTVRATALACKQNPAKTWSNAVSVYRGSGYSPTRDTLLGTARVNGEVDCAAATIEYCCSKSGNACIERGDGSGCAAGSKTYAAVPTDCGGECKPPQKYCCNDGACEATTAEKCSDDTVPSDDRACGGPSKCAAPKRFCCENYACVPYVEGTTSCQGTPGTNAACGGVPGTNSACEKPKEYCCSAYRCVVFNKGATTCDDAKRYPATPANCGGACEAPPSTWKISKTLKTPGPVAKGDVVEYEIVVEHEGSKEYEHVQITDHLPVGMSVISDDGQRLGVGDMDEGSQYSIVTGATPCSVYYNPSRNDFINLECEMPSSMFEEGRQRHVFSVKAVAADASCAQASGMKKLTNTAHVTRLLSTDPRNSPRLATATADVMVNCSKQTCETCPTTAADAYVCTQASGCEWTTWYGWFGSCAPVPACRKSEGGTSGVTPKPSTTGGGGTPRTQAYCCALVSNNINLGPKCTLKTLVQGECPGNPRVPDAIKVHPATSVRGYDLESDCIAECPSAPVPVSTCNEAAGCYAKNEDGTCPVDPELFASSRSSWWGSLAAWLTGSDLSAALIPSDENPGCCCRDGGGSDGGDDGGSTGTDGGGTGGSSSAPADKQCGACSGNSQTACESGPNACVWRGSTFGFVTVLFGGSSGTCSPEPRCLSGGESSSSRDSGASESSAASEGESSSSSSEPSEDPVEYIWYVIGLAPFDAPACSDGEDNDGDGRIDRDDPGCYDALVAGESALSRLAAAVGLTIKPWGTYLPGRETELCDPGMFEAEGKCVALPQCPARVGEAQQDRVNALLKCGMGCAGNSRCMGICACNCTASPADAAGAVADVQVCFNTCLARTSHPLCVPVADGKTSQGLSPAECCRAQCVTARCGM